MPTYTIEYRPGRRYSRTAVEDAMCTAARTLAKPGVTSLSPAQVAEHLRVVAASAMRRVVSRMQKPPVVEETVQDGLCTIYIGSRARGDSPAGYLQFTAC